MHPYTKQALATALKDMLGTKTLDKITVKDLVEACKLNRQTFYYHFQDIYDLLGWIYKTEALGAIQNNKSYATWQQGLSIILEYVESNKALCMNTCRSLGKEHLEMFLNQVLCELLSNVIHEVSDAEEVAEEDKTFIVRFYSHAFAGTLLDWIEHGMKAPAETVVSHIVLLMEGRFADAVSRFRP
ncbi:MAG: TetR/AcrR family transcriptional regulator C-terminal domain-containing protein [Paenibacillus sp.]|uniref:Transcriptional regulator, TetR family n=1 Tax=Paenibacillus aquistagni TaxID=1852522 RepID=A0A1X7LV15_9BACL|nr:TetR/AcrR family transcriptional regulator C-terminal domain-containing protein [Paenibacillus aquistagni]MBR2568701.1 TetR/AcrR family transcriptional regulator C-terminal domain-containing protein [Paenibacillus sp.]NMM54571.1 TetR family transcriptional regulator [Paenibacillus aquistagni]SMG57718.1 transcriptional regulator, TetR family [Paenibacillus aquistagni]